MYPNVLWIMNLSKYLNVRHRHTRKLSQLTSVELAQAHPSKKVAALLNGHYAEGSIVALYKS